MRIIVASANIFRRELTSYTIGEAGYPVGEAADLPALVELLAADVPRAVVIDAQIGGDDPTPTLQAVRAQSAAPILWIAEPALASPLLLADERPADALAWPYHARELRDRLVALLVRAEGAPIAPADQTRSIGAE